MDVIKMTNNNKKLGKSKCQCGLKVRLYTEDVKYGEWECPYCGKKNPYEKKQICWEFIIIVGLVLALITVIVLLAVKSVQRDSYNENHYAYRFNLYHSGTELEHEAYSNDPRIKEKPIPLGVKYYTEWGKEYLTVSEMDAINIEVLNEDKIETIEEDTT